MNMRIWLVAAALLLLSLCAPYQVRAAGQPHNQVTFSTASLQGTYAYTNDVENVGSVGLITFDGNGGVSANIKVNTPNGTGGRTTTSESGSGTYSVDPTGTGVATVQFTSSTTITATYDFVITKVAKRALAEEVFAVDEAGGLTGQLVAPYWKRISD